MKSYLPLLLTLFLVSCTDNSTAPPPTQGQQSALPESFILGTKPEGGLPLEAAKKAAKKGEDIVFQARIGGRLEPFVPGQAIMVVIDPAPPPCNEIPGDGCPTPWDYCCEPADKLLAATATVQFVGDGGKPLRIGLTDHDKLKPLAHITVVGTVSEMSEGQFLVNASGVFIDKEAPSHQ